MNQIDNAWSSATDSELRVSAEPGWAGISGAIGGCLTVVSCLSFWLCLGAFALGSLVSIEQYGSSTPVVPAAVYAFYGLCPLTLLTAILGGALLGVRAFGYKELSTMDALRATFVSALLPLRYVIGILQSLVLLAGCGVLLYPIVSLTWPIVAFVALSVAQVTLLVVARLLGGPGTVEAITNTEHEYGL